MSKEIYISSTPHETRLAIVENDDLTEIYYERENEYTLAGSIYNGKVTRVLPGMQSSFVDVGLERDAFLYITDFMEEAGDAADFDSTESNGSRRSGGEERGGNRDDRPSREAAPALQGEPGPTPDRSNYDRSGAPAVEPRNDRGDREGGRRRRGRSGGRDARPSGGDRTGGREGNALPSFPQSFTPESISEDPAVHSGYIEPGAESSGVDLGEGAPGADGSRRWRGRRGRRRGRSSVQREESQVLQQPGTHPSSDEGLTPGRVDAETVAPQDLEEDFDTEYADSFEFDAASASAPPPESATAPDTAEPVDPGFEGRGQRDRRDREPRDRNRRDRGGRDSRPSRAPRGFAPSRALYGVDSGSDDGGTDAPPAEPIILPGESLSKYRKSDETASVPSSTSVAPLPTPSTEFHLPGTWDGGAVLPGETIRPRSGSGNVADRPRSDRDRGPRDGRNFRNDRRDRNDRSRPYTQNRPGTPVPNSEHSLEGRARHEGVSAGTAPKADLDTADASSLGSPQQQPVYERHDAQPAEYDPLEGSATVRFDPRDVSEFRQSAPVLETPASPAPEVRDVEEESSSATLASHAFQSQHSQAWTPQETSHESISNSHTITPQPNIPLAPLHTEVAISTPPVHEITAIQGTGEMVSDSIAPPPQSEIAEPTSPLHHEEAILEHAAQLESLAGAPSVPTSEANPEDEEEDFGTTTLHASSIEEMDYEEDEALEGVADLGTMIREMSIDQITRPGDDPADEEDILEEEYAVEDAHPDSYEGSEEVEEDEEQRHFAESSEKLQSEEFSQAALSLSDEHSDGPTSNGDVHASDAALSRDPDRRSTRRDGGRRDHRRDGRSRDRGAERPRSTGGSGDRSTSRPGRRDGRHSAQMTNLPAISDLLKPGQEVLVQIAKEPIAKKGARITSHIALPGRFLVFMPTVNHTGVSRKIESDGERRRLKEILLSEKGEASGGFIVRTAASGASEEELRSDLRFLLNLWADIKQRSESSKSPALIYHDLNLVERVLRDQVTDTFSAIWVDTETEYERVLRFLQRFQPSLIRRVKLYTKETPLFEQFGITEEINKALRSKVWLKSGGSIVINQTEALVAIDINTGKYVGKTARLEDTIVKTNLDAIPEIVRQIRLRDLGGIIIIDFIDMDERKNRNRVMAALEEELKKDRAPSKVLQFNDFGLVAITRKRVKQSLERTLSTTCNVCQGTGMTKSPVTVCNDIYIEMRKMQKHLDRGDVMLRVHPEVVKQLKAGGTRWLQEMEEIVGKTILVKSDPSLHPEQFDIH